MNIICLDTETTGTDRYADEILQLAIIDGNGKVLFDKLVQPRFHGSWDEAQEINGISPRMVERCKPLLYYGSVIQEILESADVIVGYNLKSFDLPFIFNAGIDFKAKPDVLIVDVMLAFAEIYGEPNHRTGDFKWQKLTKCAEYYSYQGKDWHDALSDARATLFCFYKIFGEAPDTNISLGQTGVFRAESHIEADLIAAKRKERAAEKEKQLAFKPKHTVVWFVFAVFFFLYVCGGLFGALIPAAICFAIGFKNHKYNKDGAAT